MAILPDALDVLVSLSHLSNQEAWDKITKMTLDITSGPLTLESAYSDIANRDIEIGALDMYLSSCAWELWHSFAECVEKNSDRLARFWTDTEQTKAILILDGLSLRELPWLTTGAVERGFVIHQSGTVASELPGDTTAFANALGFASRSSLQEKKTKSARFPNAVLDTSPLPFSDCLGRIGSQPAMIFWHEWPDGILHNYAERANGHELFAKKIAQELTGNDFWAFVSRLATGRRLVITSDHGYAVTTNRFTEAKGKPSEYLKKALGASRCAKGVGPAKAKPFLPPVALHIENTHGASLMTLGRWRWKPAGGGYPHIAHGGLTLLELLCPYVELSMPTTPKEQSKEQMHHTHQTHQAPIAGLF